MKNFILALSLFSMSSAFAGKLTTSVTLDVKSENAPQSEFCVVQIMQPELKGYMYTTNGRNFDNMTIQNYLDTFKHYRGSLTSDTAVKSIEISAIVRDGKGTLSLMKRIVSANVSYSDTGVSDHSALEMGNLLPVLDEVDDLFAGLPGAATGALNGVIDSWNTSLQNARNSAHSKHNRKQGIIADSQVTNGLNIMGNAEAILLTQYACEDKAAKINKVEIPKYLSKLTQAMNAVRSSK